MNQSGNLGIIILLLFIIPHILFLLTLQNTLRIISPSNRRMQPAAVWLTLVPFFGSIWLLVVVSKITDSIHDECVELNIPFKNSRPSFIIGAVYCFSFLIFLIPAFQTPASFVVIITWIMYWTEVSKYKKLIERNKSNPLPGTE